MPGVEPHQPLGGLQRTRFSVSSTRAITQMLQHYSPTLVAEHMSYMLPSRRPGLTPKIPDLGICYEVTTAMQRSRLTLRAVFLEALAAFGFRNTQARTTQYLEEA